MKNNKLLIKEISKIKTMMGIITEDESFYSDNSDSYIKEIHRGLIITKPKNIVLDDTVDGTIIYGGLLDTSEKLLSEVPVNLLNKKIVVLPTFEKPLIWLLNKLKNLTKNNKSILYNLKLNITSVNAFSTGSLQIANHMNDYEYVGLMDPVLTKNLIKKISNTDKNKIEIWFSHKFWEDKGRLGKKITNNRELQINYLSYTLTNLSPPKDTPNLKELGYNISEFPDHEHEQIKKEFLESNWDKM